MSSEVEEEKEDEDKKESDASPDSKAFSLRIPRVNVSDEKTKRSSKRVNSPSPSLSSDEEAKREKPKPKRKRRSKKEMNLSDVKKESSSSDVKKEPTENKDEETTANAKIKTPSQKSSKERALLRIEHFKKLLRIAGIRHNFKRNELDEYKSNKAKLDYLKSLFEKAGFTGKKILFRSYVNLIFIMIRWFIDQRM